MTTSQHATAAHYVIGVVIAVTAFLFLTGVIA